MGVAILFTGLTLLAVAVVLYFVFKAMYHTFHGDLPKFMAVVILIFIGVGLLLFVLGILII